MERGRIAGIAVAKAVRRRKMLTPVQRLQAKDLENWEQRRVKRLPGEVDGILE